MLSIVNLLIMKPCDGSIASTWGKSAEKHRV